jgi:hypothetical protein
LRHETSLRHRLFRIGKKEGCVTGPPFGAFVTICGPGRRRGLGGLGTDGLGPGAAIRDAPIMKTENPAGGSGFRGQFAQQQTETADVRFGSLADIP